MTIQQSHDLHSRRHFMASAAQSILGVSVLPWLADAATANNSTTTAAPRNLIYLFMSGAMSHLDTFDPKPGSDVQGDTKVISTKIPGVKFGEHFSNLAKMTNQLAVVRSLSTETGAHAPGRYIMRTNYKKIATTRHPGMGPWLQVLAGRKHKTLPASVLVGGGEGAGYLGSRFAPVPIGDPNKGLQNTKSPAYLTDAQFDKRMQLAGKFDLAFRRRVANSQVAGYDELYGDAISLLRSEDLNAFDITKEPEKQREAYGSTRFGRGCLLARRLVQNGVRFVEVDFGGWDNHRGIFDTIPAKAAELDKVVSTLLRDLASRGLLDETVVVLATEFGRKPQINQNAGRDHHPAAFSCALAGGGINGGRVYGATDEKAFAVEDDPVSVQDFNATIAKALNLPLEKEIESPDGRPFTLANGGTPLDGIVG